MSDLDSYHGVVGALAGDPERMEALYREALRHGEGDAFERAIHERYEQAPGNLL